MAKTRELTWIKPIDGYLGKVCDGVTRKFERERETERYLGSSRQKDVDTVGEEWHMELNSEEGQRFEAFLLDFF